MCALQVKDMEAAPHSLPSSVDLSKVAEALHRLETKWAPWLQSEAAAGNLQTSKQDQRAQLLREQASGEVSARDMRNASMMDAQGYRSKLLESLAHIGKARPAVAQVGGASCLWSACDLSRERQDDSWFSCSNVLASGLPSIQCLTI